MTKKEKRQEILREAVKKLPSNFKDGMFCVRKDGSIYFTIPFWIKSSREALAVASAFECIEKHIESETDHYEFAKKKLQEAEDYPALVEEYIEAIKDLSNRISHMSGIGKRVTLAKYSHLVPDKS